MSRSPRHPCRPRTALGALVIASLLAAVIACPEPAGADDPRYRPPVDAPVVDPFRPPEHPYGPGNRGLEYGTEPGTPVHAAADGVVTFAGLVAGTRHVTVLHEDGLRTTASYLQEISVVVGQQVRQGDLLGTTAGLLHFSARQGDGYLDPASLFGEEPPRVRLVPFDEPPGAGEGGERSAIRQLLGLGSSAVHGAAALVDAGAAAVEAAAVAAADRTAEVVRLAAHYAPLYSPLVRTALLVRTTLRVVQRARELAGRPCTRSDERVLPPAGRRVAVLVAGLGSTSDGGAIDDVDTTSLGYTEGDVLRFSYSGGRTPDESDGFTEIAARAYGKAESQHELRRTASLLADLLEDVADASSGAPVDVYAHSQGGVVARLALIELERRHGRAWLDRVGLFATIATPHGGADLATLLHGVGSFPAGDLLLDGFEPVVGLDDDAPSAAQLSETSDVVRELADHPVPVEVEAVSIAARGDVVVPVPRARFEGAREVVVPLMGVAAHDQLPGDARTTRELGLALAGAPPACVSFAQALADQAFGAGAASIEDQAGAVLTIASALGSLGGIAP